MKIYDSKSVGYICNKLLNPLGCVGEQELCEPGRKALMNSPVVAGQGDTPLGCHQDSIADTDAPVAWYAQTDGQMKNHVFLKGTHLAAGDIACAFHPAWRKLCSHRVAEHTGEKMLMRCPLVTMGCRLVNSLPSAIRARAPSAAISLSVLPGAIIASAAARPAAVMRALSRRQSSSRFISRWPSSIAPPSV